MYILIAPDDGEILEGGATIEETLLEFHAHYDSLPTYWDIYEVTPVKVKLEIVEE